MSSWAEEQLTDICKNVAAHRAKETTGAEVVGAHLEGPFLCYAKKGAQNADFLHTPDIDMLRRLQDAAEGCVKLVTVAPEEPNGIEFVKEAVKDGITVSLGHTVASYEVASEAYKAGAITADKFCEMIINDFVKSMIKGLPSYYYYYNPVSKTVTPYDYQYYKDTDSFIKIEQ